MHQQRSLLPHLSARLLITAPSQQQHYILRFSIIRTTPTAQHRQLLSPYSFFTTIPTASSTPITAPYVSTALFAFTSLFQTHFSAALQQSIRRFIPWRRAHPCTHQATPSNWQLSTTQQTQPPPTKWLQRGPISWPCQSSYKRQSLNTCVHQSRALSQECIS
jgi:hypothetical protein